MAKKKVTKKRTKKKLGRPKGATTKNHFDIEVEVQNERCPKCESTKSITIVTSTTQNVGLSPIDKKPFDSITIRRVKCDNCPQCYIRKSFNYSGK